MRDNCDALGNAIIELGRRIGSKTKAALFQVNAQTPPAGIG
jgi:hypothetical protein